MKARGGALVSDRCSFITYGINTDLVNLGDAASKCPSVPGLRRSSRRAAMPRVRIGDVCADHPLGASARAAHPLARRAVVVARGNLPGVDRRREAALENPAAAQRRGGGCCGARSARLVHAEPVAAPPVVACFVQARGWSTGVRAGLSRIHWLHGLQILHTWCTGRDDARSRAPAATPLAREHARQVDFNQTR